MKIAIHCPLPPAATGVADYGAALVEALSARAGLAVNPTGDEGIPLYHLGNNPLHRAIYERAVRRPGVAVLHDAVLHHFFLGLGDQAGYVAEFVYNYGEWTRDLAKELWRRRARSASEPRYFEYPMLRRVVENSRFVVVHNPGAAALGRAHGGKDKVVEIPHLFHAPALPAPDEALRLRAAMGVPGGGPLFGVFGFLRESKRLAAVFRAFGRVRRHYPETRLLVAGAFVSFDLERAAAPHLRLAGVIRAGYLPEADFWRHAMAVDACINLRHPAAGETSGITIRMMGIGKAVLVTRGPETSNFPEGTCLAVDAGAAEEEMLQAYMLWLCASRPAAAELGRRASAWIRRQHSIERVAQQYLEVLERAAAR